MHFVEVIHRLLQVADNLTATLYSTTCLMLCLSAHAETDGARKQVGLYEYDPRTHDQTSALQQDDQV